MHHQFKRHILLDMDITGALAVPHQPDGQVLLADAHHHACPPVVPLRQLVHDPLPAAQLLFRQASWERRCCWRRKGRCRRVVRSGVGRSHMFAVVCVRLRLWPGFTCWAGEATSPLVLAQIFAGTLLMIFFALYNQPLCVPSVFPQLPAHRRR